MTRNRPQEQSETQNYVFFWNVGRKNDKKVTNLVNAFFKCQLKRTRKHSVVKQTG